MMNATQREDFLKLLAVKAAQMVAKGGGLECLVPASAEPECFVSGSGSNGKNGAQVSILTAPASGLLRDKLPPIVGPFKHITPLFIGKNKVKDFPDFFSN